MKIGEKIRELRILNGLTQEELAERTELSKSFISQLENDLASPSIASLTDILQILGTDLATFFSNENNEQVVYGEENYFENTKGNVTTQWLIPNAQKLYMEPTKVQLNKDSETKLFMPSEAQFFGYVLQGSIKIHIGDNIYIAKKGESFYYLAKKNHKISTRKGATFIWISSPPIF